MQRVPPVPDFEPSECAGLMPVFKNGEALRGKHKKDRLGRKNPPKNEPIALRQEPNEGKKPIVISRLDFLGFAHKKVKKAQVFRRAPYLSNLVPKDYPISDRKRRIPACAVGWNRLIALAS